MSSLSIVRVAALAFLIWFLFLSQAAKAGTLSGEVRGARGEPKGYVRVEILGPNNRTIFTDPNGRFVIDLQGGNYAVSVQERNRRNTFAVKVGESGTTHETFVLNW